MHSKVIKTEHENLATGTLSEGQANSTFYNIL